MNNNYTDEYGRRPAPQRMSHRKKKKKGGEIGYVLLLIVLLGVLAFSAVKIVSYFVQKNQAVKQQDSINDFITPVQDDSTIGNGSQTDDTTAKGEPEPEQIHVDFDALCAKYPDVIGYIYGANTGISYPIVQGTDNDFYLDHDLDGNSNNNGSIFLEERCDSQFGSGNSIIYGHHMKTGLMFAHLENYKSQSYYDAHPYFYIYTPTQNYRLDLFAGSVVEGDADIYTLDPSADLLASMVAKSTFKSKIGTPSGNIVTLSTCDYTAGYKNPRYVVLGQLTPID